MTAPPEVAVSTTGSDSSAQTEVEVAFMFVAGKKMRSVGLTASATAEMADRYGPAVQFKLLHVFNNVFSAFQFYSDGGGESDQVSPNKIFPCRRRRKDLLQVPEVKGMNDVATF